jgi:AraC-like DNA-binding protein
MMDVGWEQRIFPAVKLAIVVDSLQALGVPRGDAMAGIDISDAELRAATTLVSLDHVLQAYRNAISLTDDPRFAYETGLKSHVSAYGMYGFAILSSMNFRETMRFAVKYHRLATPLVRLHFEEIKDRAVWRISPLSHPAMNPRLYRFIVEMQFGVHVSLHRDVMGPGFVPREIRVTLDAPNEQVLYDELLGCQVLYGQSENHFVFDAAWLDGAPQFGNEITYAAVLALCDALEDEFGRRIGVAGKVRQFLLASIGRRASLEDVAERLDMPVRTLRRKLSEQGTSFRDLAEEVKAQVATKYIRDTEMTMEDIAHAVGFSDAANFRHAFRRWAGQKPLEVRRRFRAP